MTIIHPIIQIQSQFTDNMKHVLALNITWWQEDWQLACLNTVFYILFCHGQEIVWMVQNRRVMISAQTCQIGISLTHHVAFFIRGIGNVSIWALRGTGLRQKYSSLLMCLKTLAQKRKYYDTVGSPQPAAYSLLY